MFSKSVIKKGILTVIFGFYWMVCYTLSNAKRIPIRLTEQNLFTEVRMLCLLIADKFPADYLSKRVLFIVM